MCCEFKSSIKVMEQVEWYDLIGHMAHQLSKSCIFSKFWTKKSRFLGKNGVKIQNLENS